MDLYRQEEFLSADVKQWLQALQESLLVYA